MTQQINLCSPALMQIRQRFSANSLAVTLLLLLLALALLGGALAWQMARVTTNYRLDMATQEREMQEIRANLELARCSSAPRGEAATGRNAARQCI